MTTALLTDDAQLVLPTFVKTHLPLYAQIIFYGALLSVIMSTASGTLLAPLVTISENIIKEFMPHHRMSQKNLLWVTRSVVVAFTVLVVFYSLWSLQTETSIHQMVVNAYKITLACAFVPLVAGLYWKRANNLGAGCRLCWDCSCGSRWNSSPPKRRCRHSLLASSPARWDDDGLSAQSKTTGLSVGILYTMGRRRILIA